jgi:peptide/nickel transport system permease protein
LVKGLRQYVVRRVVHALIVIIGVLLITFLVSHVIPGNPAALYAGSHPTAAAIQKAKETLGLNKPIYVQFYIYVTDLLQGNLGVSIRTHNSVLSDVSVGLAATLELILFAFVIALIGGVLVGVFSASHRDHVPDHVGRVVAILGVSMAPFWLAMILQLIFAQTLNLFPLGGRLSTSVSVIYPVRTITGFDLIDSLLEGNFVAFSDTLWHLILPALALATYPFGLTVRMVRTMMIEVLQENYTRSALAWGLSQRTILFKYALKNAISSTVIAIGMSFAYSLTGAFLDEIIFVWPGLGTYTALSILALDYPAIMGAVIVVAAFYVAINLLVDIFQAFMDPRVTL